MPQVSNNLRNEHQVDFVAFLWFWLFLHFCVNANENKVFSQMQHGTPWCGWQTSREVFSCQLHVFLKCSDSQIDSCTSSQLFSSATVSKTQQNVLCLLFKANFKFLFLVCKVWISISLPGGLLMIWLISIELPSFCLMYSLWTSV